jgi:LacI family transcriptional regulator
MDVARTCGLSKTTVSVILNKTPASERVPHDTQQRVRLAAERLGYRPNWRARALASRRTHTIGVLYAPPMPLIVRGNYEGIIAGINETLHGRGYHMMFVPLGENPADWGRILLDQRMDGALQNTRHLLSLGHRNIAFLIGPQPPHYSVHQRQDGYQAAMRDAGADKYIRVINSTPDEFVRQFRDDPNRPTGVVVYTHYMAVNLLRVLWEQGLGVPKDLSVVTFTNAFPVEDVIPPLTTIALPTEEMGRAAAKMVLDQIETGGPPPKRRLVLKETLIVRKSTAPVTG